MEGSYQALPAGLLNEAGTAEFSNSCERSEHGAGPIRLSARSTARQAQPLIL